MNNPAAEANEVRERFASTKEAIATDRSLSPEGKQERLAAARETANATITNLRAEVEKAAATRRSSLELRLLSVPTPLFGTPADKIAHTASYRDAVTRAGSTITPAELLDLQNTALMTGDRLLAQATMVIGLKRGDIPVVDGWSAANPNLEADVDELFEATHPRSSNAVRRSFAFELAFAEV